MKFWVAIFLCTSASIHAQDSLDISLTNDLSFYSDVMVNASKADHRVRASQNFNQLFSRYIKKNNLFTSDLSYLEWISILQTEDNAFKLLSWQVEFDNDQFEYFGYLIYPDGSYHELKREPHSLDNLEGMQMSAEDWYGCLYYNIMKFGLDKYIIFGYNKTGKWENMKIADVLSFEKGDPVFGYPAFEDHDELGTQVYRLVLRYSSDAAVNLNFNPGLNMIAHDHLIHRMGRIPGQGPVYLPDGTYEGYELVDSVWMYREKLFDHTYDEAPRPNPVFGNSKRKDLFGKN